MPTDSGRKDCPGFGDTPCPTNTAILSRSERCYPCGRQQMKKPLSELSYRQQHKRVQDERGKASEYPCSICGTVDEDRVVEWANLTGHYEEVDDYAPMCRKCHRRFDGERRTHCVNGHEWTEDNTYIPPGRNVRQCRECQRIRNRATRRRRKDGY